MKNRTFIKPLLQKLFSVILLAGVLAGALPIDARTRRKTSAPSSKQNVSAQKPACSGGWSGVITYKKILKDSLESDEPGIRSNVDRIKHRTSRLLNYSGNAIVDGTNAKTPVVKTRVGFSDNDLNWGEERVFDTCSSRENGHWFIIESTDDRKTEAKAQGSAESFNLSVDEMAGNYRFTLHFPDADGTYNREQHIKRSGHCQPKNNEPTDISDNEATKIIGEVVQIENEKIDPKNPDTLTGTKFWGDDGSGAVRTFVYQATWKFTRCPTQILVTDIKFEDRKFPDWNSWREVSEYESTIDGNDMRIKASVANLSGETKFVEVRFFETFKGDKYDGAQPDRALQGGLTEAPIVKLDAGEEREVEIPWKSEGYAWYDDGRPRPVQRFRAEAWESDALKDSLVENLRVAPKPLILIPGVWSTVESFQIYQNLLTYAHSFDWKALTFDKQPTSIYADADDLTEFVRNAQKKYNAWHVDMAAHSSGGLVGRLYIHKQMQIQPDKRPTVKNFMMLGTPNLGVPCAQDLKKTKFGANFKVADELMPEEMVTFNKFVYERKGSIFSALAGNGSEILCGDLMNAGGNDGFVSVRSATDGAPDYKLTPDSHQELIKPAHFGDFMKPHVVTGPRGTYPLIQKP